MNNTQIHGKPFSINEDLADIRFSSIDSTKADYHALAREDIEMADRGHQDGSISNVITSLAEIPDLDIDDHAEETQFQERTPMHRHKDVSMSERSTSPTLLISKPFVQKKSWRAPITMLVSLFLGLAFAIVQDRLNNSLHLSEAYSTGAYSQQWTGRYNNALAFLVKMLFAVCVGTAYIQRQWLNISTNQESIKVKDFDVLTTSLTNAFSIMGSLIWKKQPLLLLLALVVWSIPLAVIITPASLTVQSVPNNYNQTWAVPQLTFSSDTYTLNADMARTNLEPSMILESKEVSKLAFATATTAEIRPMIPDSANMSYTLSFYGPALACQDPNNSTLMDDTESFFQSNPGYLYVAWTGNSTPWFENNTFNAISSWPTLKLGADNIPTLTVASCPENIANDPEASPGQTYLATCELYNASYTVLFSFTNFTQTISPSIVGVPTPMMISEPFSQDIADSQSLPAYLGIMSAMGNLLVGTSAVSGDVQVKSLTHFDTLAIDFSSSDDISQGLEELFQNITLSLFSNSILAPWNATETSAIFTPWEVCYVYKKFDLLLAYGLTFVISLICCAIGLHAFVMNQNSYQNTFSSYIRAAENSSLVMRDLTVSRDTGADPLPKTIGEKTMIMRLKHPM